MNICLSSRQQKELLKKANQIKVQYRDKASIPDLIFEYPEATIVLEHIENSELNWDELNKWNILSKNKLILCLADIKNVIKANEYNIKSYLGWLVNDYETLQALLKVGVYYVRIAGPLFFELEKVKSLGARVRATPNVAFEDGIPRENGIFGYWIRPEDLDCYNDYIDTIEFNSEYDLKRESALYRIYVEEKNWPGELSLLIKDLNYPVVNRLIHKDLASKYRINCRQRCQQGAQCTICKRFLDIANPELLKKASQ